MWKSLSIIAIAMSLITPVYAQSKKSVKLDLVCLLPEEVVNVTKRFREENVFAGLDDLHGVKNLTTVVYLNKDTKTFSVLFLAPDQNLVCVLSSGIEGKMLYNN